MWLFVYLFTFVGASHGHLCDDTAFLFDRLPWLMTAFAGKVKQSVASVRLVVSTLLDRLTFEVEVACALTRSPGIESKGYRSRLRVRYIMVEYRLTSVLSCAYYCSR